MRMVAQIRKSLAQLQAMLAGELPGVSKAKQRAVELDSIAEACLTPPDCGRWRREQGQPLLQSVDEGLAVYEEFVDRARDVARAQLAPSDEASAQPSSQPEQSTGTGGTAPEQGAKQDKRKAKKARQRTARSQATVAGDAAADRGDKQVCLPLSRSSWHVALSQL